MAWDGIEEQARVKKLAFGTCYSIVSSDFSKVCQDTHSVSYSPHFQTPCFHRTPLISKKPLSHSILSRPRFVLRYSPMAATQRSPRASQPHRKPHVVQRAFKSLPLSPSRHSNLLPTPSEAVPDSQGSIQSTTPLLQRPTLPQLKPTTTNGRRSFTIRNQRPTSLSQISKFLDLYFQIKLHFNPK